MPTTGGARATQKILQEAAGNPSDVAVTKLSGADLTFAVNVVESSLPPANQAKLSGADALHYDANN